MNNTLKFIFLDVWVILLLSACSSTGSSSSEPQPESMTFMAEGIHNTNIQFIWLEVPSPIQPGEDGTFTGKYTYKACPECIECYMNWDYTLEITGKIMEEKVVLDIAVKHIGQNVQGSFVHAELGSTSNPEKEPQITCNRKIECKEITFVPRSKP